MRPTMALELFYCVANRTQEDVHISWLYRKQAETHDRDLPIEGGYSFKLREDQSQEGKELGIFREILLGQKAHSVELPGQYLLHPLD